MARRDATATGRTRITTDSVLVMVVFYVLYVLLFGNIDTLQHV